MSGNVYLNYLYVSLVEIPAILIIVPLVKLMPRKVLLGWILPVSQKLNFFSGSLMSAGGISCLLVLVIPSWGKLIAFTGTYFSGNTTKVNDLN